MTSDRDICQLESPETSGWRRLVSSLSLGSAGQISTATSDAAARLLTDTLICSFAGANGERSAMLRSALGYTTFGEAQVFGTKLRGPAVLSACANAESANLLDADDTFLNGAHFGALVVTTALAAAERVGGTLEQLLWAITAGFELNARLVLAHRAPREFLPVGMLVVGAAASAAIAGNCEPSAFACTLGLAMRAAPAPTEVNVALQELSSIKYGPYGSMAATSVLCALSGACGYVSSADYMTSKPGFLQSQGATSVEWRHLVPPGQDWWISQTSLKPYPLFRVSHPAVDALSTLMGRHNLKAPDIESLYVQLDPRAAILPFHLKADRGLLRNDHLLPIYAQMSLKLALSMVVLGIAPGPRWSAPELVSSQCVREMMYKIELAAQPLVSMSTLAEDVDGESGRIRRCIAKVTIRGPRGMIEEMADFSRGDPWSPHPPDWSFLAEKESNFCGGNRIGALIRSADNTTPIRSIIQALH